MQSFFQNRVIILAPTAFWEGGGEEKHADMQSELKKKKKIKQTCDCAGVCELGALVALLIQTHTVKMICASTA